MGDGDSTGERGRIHGISMIVGTDLYLSRGMVEDRLISPAVPKMEFEGFSAERES